MRTLLIWLPLLINATAFSQDSIAVAPATNDLHRYNIFLKGEFHDRRLENEHSFLLLAKYLHINNNVRHLVFEYGPDFSYLANRYLQTQIDLMPGRRYLYFSKAFWDSLVLYNNAQPSYDRLKIHAFDFNRSISTAMAFGEMILHKEALSDAAIQFSINKIIEWKTTPWTWEGQEKFVDQMNALRSLCKNKEALLMQYFGEDWLAFAAILNHNVKSKSTVDRDKKVIKYLTTFLTNKSGGEVLFNYGISHTFLNGVGFGKMLDKNSRYAGKVCSIYPYYQLPPEEKSKIQSRKDSYLPINIIAELEQYTPYALINLEHRGLYPTQFKISQWVYVIPKAKQP